jgi:hypothetical protein
MIQVQNPKKISSALEKEISFTKYLYLMILASDENEEQQQEGMERVLPERRNGSPTTLREITNSSKRKEEEISEKGNFPRHSSKNPSGDLEYIIVEMNDLEVQSEKKTSE